MCPGQDCPDNHGKISIPTIGIGAGRFTDGQVLVIHDAIGLFERYTPKFVKRYINLSPMILKALEQYKNEVIEGIYQARNTVLQSRKRN